MATILINSTLTLEDNASGDADYPGMVMRQNSDGSYTKAEVTDLSTTEVIIDPAGEAITIATLV